MEFNIAQVVRTVAEAVPDREAIVHRDRRLTYAGPAWSAPTGWPQVLHAAGLGAHRERAELARLGVRAGPPRPLPPQRHRVPRGHARRLRGPGRALQRELPLRGRGARATCSPTARARAIVYHSSFAPTLEAVRPDLPDLEVLLQVPDASGARAAARRPLVRGGPRRGARHGRRRVEPSPDDLYILYTGGTTGMPKGVLWRQADIYPAALGGRQRRRRRASGRTSSHDRRERPQRRRPGPARAAVHARRGALDGPQRPRRGQHRGAPRATPPRSTPPTSGRPSSSEAVNIVLIVGDAFGRPLLDELDRGAYDLSSLVMIVSGGAALSAPVKGGAARAAPRHRDHGRARRVRDRHAGQPDHRGRGARPPPARSPPAPGMAIVSEDLTERPRAG